MKIAITKKIGFTDFTFEVDNDQVEQAFQEASKIDRSVSTICGYCKSKNLVLSTNEGESKGKKFIFVKIRCLDCSGYRKLGQNADGSGWFFHNWAKYDPETKTETKLEYKKKSAPQEETDLEF